MVNAPGSGDTRWYNRRLHGPLLWLAWTLTVLLIAYIALVIYRIPAVNEQKKSDAAVAAIEAKHLTMDDVDGDHLPPPPDPNKVNATVAGVDANGNGIRDDVELAIFAEYPTSSATSTAIRAAELQYAMAEQMFLTDVFDSATWKAVAETNGRAYLCLTKTSNSTDYAKEIQNILLNTPGRELAYQKSFSFETSFGNSSVGVCDLYFNP